MFAIKKYLLLSIVASLLLGLALKAQEVNEFPDSALFYLKRNSPFFFREMIALDQKRLDGFHNYQPKEGIDLGNINSPFYSFFPNFYSPLGFELGLGKYNRKLPNEVSNYWVNIPYTRGMAVLGAKREQVINVLHTQNIKQNWNVSLNVNHIDSRGFYKRQRTKGNFVNLGLAHFSLNKFYEFQFNYLLGNYKSEENGGIQNITDLQTKTDEDKFIFDVRYDTVQVPVEVDNLGETRDIRFKQYLNFGIRHFVRDSAIGFTNPKFRLFMASRLTKSFYKYNEADAEAMLDLEEYDDVFIDPEVTNDVTTIHQDRFNIGVEKLIDTTKWFGSGLTSSIDFESGKVVQNGEVLNFSNFGASGGMKLLSKRHFSAGLKGNTIIRGYNEKEWSTSGWGTYYFDFLKSSFAIEYRTESKLQDYFFLKYNSNHFRWNNQFPNKYIQGLKLEYLSEALKLGIEINLRQIENYVFLNGDSKPELLKKNLTIGTIQVKDTLRVGKFFLNNNLILNNSSNDTVLPLPKVFVFSQLYFQTDLFNKVARVQIGTQLRFYSKFFAGYFNPSLNSFVVQSEKKYGSYPFLDFFINARVKKVKVFFKIDHLNQGLNGFDYFLFPNRPYNDFAIKLGLEWIFLK